MVQAVSRKAEAIEPRYYGCCEVAEGIEKPEGTIANVTYGQTYAAPPGSESMACTKSRGVNVGDPQRSSRDGSIGSQA